MKIYTSRKRKVCLLYDLNILLVTLILARVSSATEASNKTDTSIEQHAQPNVTNQVADLFGDLASESSALEAASSTLLAGSELGEPSVAQMTAAATAAGLLVGDLIGQAASADGSPAAYDAIDDAGQAVYESRNQRELPVGSVEALQPDQMPDSMESLMASEREELDENPIERTDEPQLKPSNMVLSEDNRSSSSLAGRDSQIGANEDDDDDESAGSDDKTETLVRPLGDQPASPVRDSADDLSAAAGHYYGKKKKKVKIVIKKKKKKKKKHKMKKVKIVKYKKVKKKKKKKPKKYHHHDHDHGKYYMYAKVPDKKSWEFGFKKGNKKHWIERHEKGHKNKFKTKVKWYDKKSKGKGIHIWDYNHHDKKKKHYG